MAYPAQRENMISRRRSQMAELKYQKYIVTELKTPEEVQKIAAEYAKRATRILWLDDDVVEGAFHVNCAWYWKATEEAPNPAHTHDFDEVIAFFGSDPQNPHDLGGEVEFWLEDEKYILTKSCLIFAPRGMKHCPLRVIRIDRPIFHFTIGTGGKYIIEGVASR
jgi:hypothetical protein